jgi:NTP pyrophosphatase (non-canonical NTP hydrolase)
MEKLYQLAQGYRTRFPEGDEPFQMVTRLLEECGEIASEVNLWEGSGVKRQKHGEPKKENLANEIKQALAALTRIATYYKIEQELEASINKTLSEMKDGGLI